MTSVFDFEAVSIDGRPVALDSFRGNALLIVNVASKCGFTPQYAGLESLHRKYHDRGFSVLGFPCNQFMGQEPGDEQQIAGFCATTFDVSFPMFAKVEVNGAQAHPLYAWLKSRKSGLLGGAIPWNFTKFLTDRTGEVAGRFPPTASPESLAEKVEAVL